MLYDWLRHIEFAYPKLLSLFIILPVFIWWYVRRYNKNQGALKMSPLILLQFHRSKIL
jgi:hypothetical protein